MSRANPRVMQTDFDCHYRELDSPSLLGQMGSMRRRRSHHEIELRACSSQARSRIELLAGTGFRADNPLTIAWASHLTWARSAEAFW